MDGLPAQPAALTVVEAGNHPVAGAVVHVESSQGWVPAGTTGADGRLSFAGGRGVVRHPDYLPGEFEVPEGGRVLLTLQAGGAIDGAVTGLEAGEGERCTIVARARSESATTLVQRVEQGSPRLLEARCGPDGSFRLTGVQPGRQYVVEGNIHGMASAPANVTAGTFERPGKVVVQMIDVWGALVVFAGPDGSRLQTPDHIDVSRSKPAAHFIPSLPPGFQYASGIYGLSFQRFSGGARLGMADGRYRDLIVMTPDPGTGPAPPVVSFSLQLPGYEPSNGEVMIRPFREAVPVLEVELVPRADSFGSLDVEFLGAGYLDRFPAPVLGAEYELRLQERGGDRIAMKYSVPLRGRDHMEGIPAGTYDVVFEGLGKSLNVVPEGSPVRIGPDTNPTLAIELGTFGSIQVEPIQKDGTLYDAGPIQVQLITETEPGLGQPMYYYLPAPPYVLRHISPGPHYLVLLSPQELVYSDPDSVPLDTVFVTESTIATARFLLP